MKNLYSTDIALLGVWDPAQVAEIKSFENSNILALINEQKAVIWNTKMDGMFAVGVRVNEELTEEEKQKIYKKVTGMGLEVKGDKVSVGSPEGIKTGDVAVAPGKYTAEVDAILSEENGKKYLDYVVKLQTIDGVGIEKMEKVPVLEYYIPQEIDLKRIAATMNGATLIQYLKELTLKQLGNVGENVTIEANKNGEGEFEVKATNRDIKTDEIYKAIFKRLNQVFRAGQGWTRAKWTITLEGKSYLEVS